MDDRCQDHRIMINEQRKELTELKEEMIALNQRYSTFERFFEKLLIGNGKPSLEVRMAKIEEVTSELNDLRRKMNKNFATVILTLITTALVAFFSLVTNWSWHGSPLGRLVDGQNNQVQQQDKGK